MLNCILYYECIIFDLLDATHISDYHKKIHREIFLLVLFSPNSIYGVCSISMIAGRGAGPTYWGQF
jgi:hypothetical protein